MPKAKSVHAPWNKGKAVGQKAPFTPEQVYIIRQLLHAEGHLRDLALFNTAIDTLLRASDLLTLKVEDVTDHYGSPRKYSTHSLRRTKSSVVYERTGNLEVCRQILGHHSIANTALYLGVDKRQALHVAKAILI